jgi:hypothetical protein
VHVSFFVHKLAIAQPARSLLLRIEDDGYDVVWSKCRLSTRWHAPFAVHAHSTEGTPGEATCLVAKVGTHIARGVADADGSLVVPSIYELHSPNAGLFSQLVE